ncbi:NAD(P)H-dependent oxidoreductase [Christensenellaceae bacterium OttesenSCG-928-L17]|nr:NAD(P)H-dependent oxidoreductase [Christensenellaceae bacterium OttesenSCG-928-L17]
METVAKTVQLHIVKMPGEVSSDRLLSVLRGAAQGFACDEVREIEEIKPGIVLFALDIGAYGINAAYTQLLERLRRGEINLNGCIAGLVVDGGSELYTKSVARELVLALNTCGCLFVGRPLVEATGTLHNFCIQAQAQQTDLHGAYVSAVRELLERLCAYEKPQKDVPRLLTLHASNRRSSNTYALWEMVKKHLTGVEISEIMLRNGAVADCEGCAYTTCLHFSERGKCFYGGVVVEEVFPALLSCDALMLLCPNYNDAVDANMTAFINRMTGLFRTTRFYEKSVFGIVVSGYSGGDIVASQIVSALNMNKSFQLPARFCMLETANDPGSIYHIAGIEERAQAFARAMKQHMQR